MERSIKHSNDGGEEGVSRRSFLGGVSAAAVGSAMCENTPIVEYALAAEPSMAPVIGPDAVPATLRINGIVRRLVVPLQMTLAEVLRGPLGLTGTKIACNRGACSACTVWLDGAPVASCMILAVDVGDRSITTIEGLADGERLHPMQAAFIEHDAMQCGFCTPGLVMSCAALVARNPDPSPDDVKTAISGHLCRCGTYQNVIAATMAAAKVRKGVIAAMSTLGSRTERFCIGIAGVSQGQIDREIPASEPPPLAPNADLAVVGKSVPRVGGRAMVTGAARYTVDVKLPGMLIARVLRSPHPHARILSVDTSTAERYPGVRAVHVVTAIETRAAVRGATGTPATFPPALYVGASLAAVAATTQSVANEAIRLLKVKYEILPFVVDMDEARRPEAPLVFKGAGQQTGAGGAAPGMPQVGNVRGPSTNSFYGGPRGNVDQGFREAEVIVEGEFCTQVQTHCCLEPHAVVADWRADGLTLYISTQDTAGVRKDVAAAFGLPREKVRVITEFMGGGFGSKLGVGDYVFFAVELSRKAGAPVSLIFDREEEQLASGNRPGTWQRLRMGARRDGALTAISLLSYGTAGIAAGAGVGNIAQAMYDCPNFEMAQYDVFMHAGPGCAMRAPGNVQGAFALEQSVDELAEKLRHRSNRVARSDRSERGATRGAPDRCCTFRLEPASFAGSRCRTGKARRRHGAVVLAGHRSDQRLVRGAAAARRLSRGSLKRAGYWNRHPYRAGAGRCRRIGAAHRRYFGPHWGYELLVRSKFRRQQDHRVDHAGRAQGRLSGSAGFVRGSGS